MTPFDFDWHWPNGDKVARGRRIVYDIETNGLLDTVSKFHSLVLHDLDSGEVISCCDQPGYVPIAEGLNILENAELAIGHNVLGYDRPAIAILRPDWKPPFHRDTLILTKMLWPTDRLKELDFPRWRAQTLPGNLIGAQGLEAWGYRLGEMKGDYSKTVKEWSKKLSSGEITLDEVPTDFHVLLTSDSKGNPALDPWLAWNKPMQDYCEQDVRVNVALLKVICGHLNGTCKPALGIGWSPRSVALEHDVWLHLMAQEKRGFGYDLKAGVKLAVELKNRKADLERQIRKDFGEWWEPLDDKDTGTLPAINRSVKRADLPDVTVPRVGVSGRSLAPYVGPPKEHYSTDAPFVRIERRELNPGSPRQLGDRLMAVFGWQPTDWVGVMDNKTGHGVQAKLDETVLKEMEDSILPVALKELLLEYLVVKKTLGQLADGKKSWNTFCGDDGRIHGRVDPLGTITHRGAHKDPPLGQVPAVSFKEDKDEGGNVISKEIIWGWKGGFGAECRALFFPNSTLMPCQTGTDASGLELRGLGHRLYKHDGGIFARRVSTPGLDIHAENAKITGLTRADTKTTTYAFLYGAGNLKIGVGVGVAEDQIDRLASSSVAKSYDRFLKKIMRDKYVPLDRRSLALVARGSEVSKAFLEGIDGLKDLKAEITAEANERGFIIAIDGRKLYTRKAHAALNTALQGDGAVICKMWMMETHRILTEDLGLVEDVDFGQMAFVHDELQFMHKDGLGVVIGDASKRAIENVGRDLEYQCPLSSEYMTGVNWKTCH